MKSINHVYVIIILILNLVHFGYGQELDICTPSSEIAYSGYVNYKTTKIDTGDAVFTLFGDGYFTYQDTFGHQFLPKIPEYTTVSYFSKRYKRDIPTKREKGTGIINSNGDSTNNKISMDPNTNSKITTSWSPCEGIENFFLLIFQNTDTVLQSGCIEFYYNYEQLDLNAPKILDYNWVSKWEIMSVGGLDKYNHKLTWEFNNLDTGEQRVVYIPMTSLVEEGTKLHLGSKYISNCGGGGIIQDNSDIYTKGSPHDPNIKIADKECIKSNYSHPQKITYNIHFQNEGDAPADTVVIRDTLDLNFLDINRLKIVDSEYDYTYKKINGNILEITFPGIKLPGLKQKTPKTYTYHDTESYVIFEICTLEDLDPNVILNRAGIYFDTQPVVLTPYSEISIKEAECSDMVEKCDSTVNTIETIGLDVIFSPNPVSHSLFVGGMTDQEVSLNIYNNRGELVFSKSEVTKRDNIIDTSNLMSGMYFVQIKNKRINITKKVVKL